MSSAGRTIPADDIYAENVQVQGRGFSRYSIANDVYYEPVDEVSRVAATGDVF
jgi:hypothetical protein